MSDTPPRPLMYKRSVAISESVRDEMYELAERHDRNFADEVRHALRVYIAVNRQARKKEAA